MRRKFLPRKDFPIYHNTLDMFLNQSSILNPDEIPNAHSLIEDKRNILYAIAEIEGDENGQYPSRNGELVAAMIPMTKKKIEEFDKRFEFLKNTKRKEGFKIPTVFPPDWLNDYYTLQARLSAYEAESEALNKRLSEWVDEEQKTSDDQVLAFGLRCFGKLRNGELESIDGQTVSENDNGIMIITDNRSPYNGLAVEDYREFSKKWIKSRKEENKRKLFRLQNEAKEKGNPIPKQLNIASPNKVKISSLPPFPVEYRNYLVKRIRLVSI
jgi:hypothetical protein